MSTYESHQQTPLSPRSFFNDDSSRFRFCCCYVRTWAYVIGALQIVGAAIDLAWTIKDYSGGGDPEIGSTTTGALVWGIFEFFLWIAIASLMVYGVSKEKHLLLIPYIVMQFLSIVGSFIYAIVFFVMAGRASHLGGKYKSFVGAGIGGGLAMLVGMGLQILFVYAVIRCYRYLKEKALAAEAASYVPMASSYSAIGK